MTTMSLPRPRRIRPLAIFAASVALVAASQAGMLLQARPATPATGPAADRPLVDGPLAPIDAPAANAPGSIGQIDHSIAAWTRNLAGNDKDFLSASNLAVLYEARARLSGDIGDYTRAEEAANRSLAIVPAQLDLRALHARLAFATHDFVRALSEAESLNRTAPDQPAILSIIADAKLELGDVDAAEAGYREIAKLTPGPAIDARLARLAFLRGDPAAAVAGAETAFAEANADGQQGPGLSWYAYLAGFLNLTSGAPDAAATWFDRALEAWPESHLALAGRARTSAALGDIAGAIAGYRAATAISPQPEAVAALGDLLALHGDEAGAKEQYATVRAIARLQGSGGGLVYNRQLALFEVNHAGDVAEALSLAERELRARKDVYGYDAYAWALLANGRATEADAAMATALALGTWDASLLDHAGEIALAVGDTGRARELLTASLSIKGALDPTSAARADAALESIR